MIRERVMALGQDSIYNLTGLVRTFPLQPQDLESLENQFTYYTHFLGRAEALALRHTGADPRSARPCRRSSRRAARPGSAARRPRPKGII
jgi:hypothetical protein